MQVKRDQHPKYSQIPQMTSNNDNKSEKNLQMRKDTEVNQNSINDITNDPTTNKNTNENEKPKKHHKQTNQSNDDDNNNENDEMKRLLIEKAFEMANSKGKFDKSLLPPNLCRTNTMTLWRDVLIKNQYNNIKILQLRWCAIQSAGAKILADGLGNTRMDSLDILDLMGNEIGVSGSRALASLLAPGIDLDTFVVQDSRSVLAQFEGREKIGYVKQLILSYNVTSDAGCGYIGKALCISNTLHTLELENCDISDNGCKYLRRGIERNHTLLRLNIAANRFGDLGAREIQSFLVRNNSLQYLDISRNRLGANRTMDVAKGLAMNHSLIKLRMNINRTSARGAKILAKMLMNNHTLEELELSYNEIFSEGVQLLSQGLIQNRGLKRLVLWYNGLEDPAARNIAKALQQRSQQPHFRNDMVQSVAASQQSYFFTSDNNNKLRPDPDTYHICEVIVDYVPVYMYFEVDLSHNRRITKNGIQTLLDVANQDNICVRGLKDLLIHDRKEREAAALEKTSLY